MPWGADAQRRSLRPVRRLRGDRPVVVGPRDSPPTEFRGLPHRDQVPDLGHGPGAVPDQDLGEEGESHLICHRARGSKAVGAAELARGVTRPDAPSAVDADEGSPVALSVHGQGPCTSDGRRHANVHPRHARARAEVIAPRRGRARGGPAGAERNEGQMTDECRSLCPRQRRRSIFGCALTVHRPARIATAPGDPASECGASRHSTSVDAVHRRVTGCDHLATVVDRVRRPSPCQLAGDDGHDEDGRCHVALPPDRDNPGTPWGIGLPPLWPRRLPIGRPLWGAGAPGGI